MTQNRVKGLVGNREGAVIYGWSGIALYAKLRYIKFTHTSKKNFWRFSEQKSNINQFTL